MTAKRSPATTDDSASAAPPAHQEEQPRRDALGLQGALEPVDVGALTAELARDLRQACARVGLTLDVDRTPTGESVDEASPIARDAWEAIVGDLLARVGARLETARATRERDRGVHPVLENISEGCQVLSADWRTTYLNARARSWYAERGIDPQWMIGRNFRDEVCQELPHPDIAAHMYHAMRGRVSVSVDERDSSSGRWCRCRFDPLPDGGLACFFADITERRSADDRLAADLAAMTRLQEVSTRLVAADDPTSLLLEIIDAAIGITGADMGNIQLLDRESGSLRIVASRGFGRAFLDFFDAVRDGEGACGAAMARNDRVIIDDVETSPVFADTPALDALRAAGVRAVQSTPLVARSGRLVGMLSTHRRSPGSPAEPDLRTVDLLARQAADWIERTQNEEALRDSERRFRRYFELGLIGMAITSPTRGCLDVNQRICEILGYEREALLGKTWAEMTHPDDLAADTAQFQRVLAGEIDGYVLDKRWIRKDGRIVDSTISVKCLRRPDGSVDYFVSLLEDTTERKRAEEALRQSVERYRLVVSQVKDYAIFSSDEHGIVTTWNEGCREVLGYAEPELVGRDFATLFTTEDRAAGVPRAELRRAAETGSSRHDRWMLAKRGRRFFAIGATAALRGADGGLAGFSTVMRDMTQMKLSQDALAHRGESLARLVSERTDALERATERLRLSERMAGLGTLAAGLGHDMGNLLLPMDVRLHLLLQADLPKELRDHVLGIRTCAGYLQQVSNGLRALAVDPLVALRSESTELGAWWSDVALILKNVLPRGVEFAHVLPRHPAWVAIGRAALTQAVFNVVQNSADALTDRGTGRVTIGVENDARTGWVVVWASDDGPGMTEEVRRRCLEPYFSTKERAVSTGMGLALVHALITAAGGRVDIESFPGAGTTIRLFLPRAIAEQSDAKRSPPPGAG